MGPLPIVDWYGKVNFGTWVGSGCVIHPGARHILASMFRDPGIQLEPGFPETQSDFEAVILLCDLMIELEEMQPGSVR